MTNQLVFWDDLVIRANQKDWKNFDSAKESITIADMRQEDAPLIYVNKGFERITGYSRAETLGRNCRFLQGIETDRNEVNQMRTAIQNGEKCIVEFINYKKNGDIFWNRLSLTPIMGLDKKPAFYIGLQNDITDMKYIEHQISRHLRDAISKLG